MEGFATGKNLRKEDGTNPVADEKLPFVVIEFNKNSHKIVLSHVRTYQEGPKPSTQQPAAQNASPNKMLQNLNAAQQHTTLGAIPELAQLHEELKEKN